MCFGKQPKPLPEKLLPKVAAPPSLPTSRIPTLPQAAAPPPSPAASSIARADKIQPISTDPAQALVALNRAGRNAYRIPLITK